MKKNLFIAIFSAVLAVVAVYIIVTRAMDNDGATQGNQRKTITPMSLPEKTFHQSPEDYNRFAVESYLKVLREKSNANVVFSPYSLSMALEILYAGAEGETAATLEKVLHLTPSDAKEPTHPALFDYVLPETENPDVWANPPIFLFGNAMWYDNKLKLNTDYARKMEANYSLKTRLVDFDSGTMAIVRQMNAWCNRTTQGLIPSLDPHITPETTFCLLNTLYFKSHWDYKFQTGKTKDAPFTLVDGRTISVPTMCDEHGFPYFENDELRVLEMRYFPLLSDGDTGKQFGGHFSMVFILPKAVDGIYELEKNLTAEKIDDLVKQLQSTGLEVAIPKFRLEQENDLLSLLTADGQLLGGNFTRMFPGRTIPADAISTRQKIMLGIDEHGTEAAVATEIGYVSLGSEPPKFIVDHPFLFLIREQKTGTILFLGRVMNPMEK